MDTPANRAADLKADPLQWVRPAQVAALLVHLASDAGSQVTAPPFRFTAARFEMLAAQCCVDILADRRPC